VGDQTSTNRTQNWWAVPVPSPWVHVMQNAANENRSDWKSTASATAKLLLRGVRDSADAFPPLKSVAGGLCFILENYEVWFTCRVHPIHTTHRFPSAQANNQAIESLAPRIKSLAESLCAPVSEGDTRENQGEGNWNGKHTPLNLEEPRPTYGDG
jgi:hypothetical protein